MGPHSWHDLGTARDVGMLNPAAGGLQGLLRATPGADAGAKKRKKEKKKKEAQETQEG